VFGQMKAQNKPYQDGIPIAANFFGKTIKFFEKRSEFISLLDDAIKSTKLPISLIMMSPKIAHDYLMRKIMRVDDFQLIIFQDLSSFNDKHHQWLAEDFYQDCILE
jgi:hypothetical protein